MVSVTLTRYGFPASPLSSLRCGSGKTVGLAKARRLGGPDAPNVVAADAANSLTDAGNLGQVRRPG